MKKLLGVLALVTVSVCSFSQMEVGKSKAELKAEKPKRIGLRATLLKPEYELWSVDKDGVHTEYLRYLTNGLMNSQLYNEIHFNSLKEEADFYKYVFDLFDNFKDNEILLNKYKIVPHPMKVGGVMNNITFDVYESHGSSAAYTTGLISQKGWVKLFADSKIHSQEAGK